MVVEIRVAASTNVGYAIQAIKLMPLVQL